MHFSYNAWLAGLSVIVAITVAYTALRLASRVAESQGAASRAWLILGALSMGVGTWSMHFIGMLALSAPVSLRYDVAPTILSLGIAILTSGFAIGIASRHKLALGRHIVCSMVMGIGIASMHYTGMGAISIVPGIAYDPMLAAASIAIAVVASFAALWLTFKLKTDSRRHARLARIGAAVVMGLAIVGMHYTGMAAARIAAGAVCIGGVSLDNHWFAISVAIATLALLAITMMTCVFDAHLEARARLHSQRMKKANSRLDHQATHDALTDLPNRTLFLERMQAQLIANAAPGAGESLSAVMLVDLDRFMIVNDSLGHGIGDAVLREAAVRLQAVVGSGAVVARLGGDEFLVLVAASDPKQVMLTANRIGMRLSQTYLIQGVELHLTASVGVTTSPFDRAAPEVLISHAEEAMYDAKRDGGNSVRFFVPGTTLFTAERLKLESDLWDAAARDELEVHYQPQVDIGTGRIVGLEALARWHHPIRGWISPAEFIPIAEASDLIVRIGQRILDAACRQARAWRDLGFEDLSIAVNLSARQFRQPDLLSMIRLSAERNGLAPGQIVIELTETVVMSDAHRSAETLDQLHRSGFPVAVDDFGTGYSSMSYLKRLPVSKLKIDRSFVGDLGVNSKSDSIVRAVITLAHGLGMTVVAEGVETRAQLAILRAFGCDQYQGFLFSKPVPASGVPRLLQGGAVPVGQCAGSELADALLSASG